MAGDWIKWTKGLARKPEVLCIAARLGKTRHEVAGLLMELWEWADENVVFDAAVSGSEPDSDCGTVRLGDQPKQLLDVVSGVSGFADALAAVNWIEVRSGSLTFPNFGRHNGKTAKARALDSTRKRTAREGGGQEPDGGRTRVRKPSGCEPDKTATREEKRREEKRPKTPLPPAAGGSADAADGFAAVPADGSHEPEPAAKADRPPGRWW